MCPARAYSAENIIHTTHAAEPDAINRLHSSGAGFWYVCHMQLWDRTRRVPDSGSD